MERLLFKLPMDWNLFLFGDDHEGAALRYDHGWSQLVDMMHSPYGGLKENRNYGVHHGDIIEAIMTDDYRYTDFETKESTVLAQIYAAIKNLDQIKDRMLCLLNGNHTRKLHRFGEIAKHICKETEIPYGTWSAILTYKTQKDKVQFKHFATHGSGSINSTADDPQRRKTNMLLSLKRKLKNKFGDTLLNSMGHTHKCLIGKPTEDLFLSDDGEEIQQFYTGAPSGSEGYIHPDFRYYVNSGSFLKLLGDGFDGYGEVAGYDPIELAFCVVRIRGGDIQDIDKVVLE